MIRERNSENCTRTDRQKRQRATNKKRQNMFCKWVAIVMWARKRRLVPFFEWCRSIRGRGIGSTHAQERAVTQPQSGNPVAVVTSLRRCTTWVSSVTCILLRYIVMIHVTVTIRFCYRVVVMETFDNNRSLFRKCFCLWTKHAISHIQTWILEPND